MANERDVANDLDNERCVVCGALLRMVGRSHRCNPPPLKRVSSVPPKLTKPSELPKLTEPGAVSNTYRYRNVELRRTYMRDLMRRRRALLVR